MNELVIATGNEGKLREFRTALSGLPLTLLSARDLGLHDFPPEEGSSYQENAAAKATFVTSRTGLASLGDDSGLEVAALDGAPGLYSARYGSYSSNADRIAYLLQQLRSVPQEARSARFVCVLALATPQGDLYTFQGECEGRILQAPHGKGGFGYDPVFYSPDLGKSFAEADAAEKERVSHRGRALKRLKIWLTSSAGAGLERSSSNTAKE